MIVFILTVVASLAALAGGYVALKSQRQLHLAMALTSGLVLGLVAFDLLPEMLEGAETYGIDLLWPMLMFVVGFLAFHVVEKLILVHEHAESEYGPHTHPKLGFARATALAAHSFFDGLSIGVAFQVNATVGAVVALAVIGHRFADGFDTANFMLLHKNKEEHIKKFMSIVIIMPVLGGLTSLVYTFSESTLVLYIGLFAGILMYIAASNILPQAHGRGGSPYKSVGLTVLGVALMMLITHML